MTNEARAVDDSHLLSVWVIHFSFSAGTTSILSENLENSSNNHFSCKITSSDQSKLPSYVYLLTQIFLCKDIETLRRVIVKPEEIHKLVKQMETLQESLNECGELEGTKMLKENGKIPEVKCNIIDGKCVSLDVLITDQFDPNHNLRCLLRDLQTYAKTVTRGITRKIESNEEHSQPVTQRKSRKRKANSLERYYLQGKIPKMKTIDTYFKKETSRTEGKRGRRKHQELNEERSSREVEIICIDDDNSYCSHQLKVQNELRKNHIDKVERNPINNESPFLETHCDPEDEICIVAEKGRTPTMTPTEKKGIDTDVCVTQDRHAKRVTRMSVSKREKLERNCKKDNCTKRDDTEMQETVNVTDNVINIDAKPSKSDLNLDASTREEIRDWCGGDTFLTQESSPNSGEVTEWNGMDDRAGNKQYDKNNNKCNKIDNDGNDVDGDDSDDDDDDDDSGDDIDDDEEEDENDDDDDYIYDSEDESDSDGND